MEVIYGRTFAGTYIAFGEIDKGIEWIEKSFDEGLSFIIHITLPPFYSRLRSHPRCQSLLRKMNLEP